MRNRLSQVMKLAWQFVKKNGMGMAEAMRRAWVNIKLVAKMHKGIAKFYFQKVDGTLREAYGTLEQNTIADKVAGYSRKTNDTIQTYFDTEKGEWRCFKKANLMRIA